MAATEAEVRTIWQNAVDILDTLRDHFDDTHVSNGAGGDGKIQTLEDSLTGEFIPAPLAAAVASIRAGMSNLISPAVARSFLDPIIFEYGKVINDDATALDTFGGAYEDVDSILLAMYEFFVANGTTVETRGIDFTPSVTYDGSNTGNGKLRILTVDENTFELEACTVEKKFFRCRSDQNSGEDEHAEIFEVMGEQASKDFLQLGVTGSGMASNTTIVSRHAGSGSGGSLLTNGSFTDFDNDNTNEKFTGWAQTYTGATGADVTQDSTLAYRGYPGEGDTSYSCKLTIDGTTEKITMKQTLDDMVVSSLRRDRPYFFRVMVNKGASPATGGNFIIRMGSQTVTTAVTSGLAGSSAWNEIIIPIDENCWFTNFNDDPFDVEIEWDANGDTPTNSLYIDDCIFCEMDLIDGLYYVLTHNQASPTPWRAGNGTVDGDRFYWQPTYGSTNPYPGGKLQWWLYYAYGRYLPGAYTSSDHIADP